MNEAMLVAVVDDDAAVGRAIRRLLESDGFRVATFLSADEFLADIRLEQTGCLLLDLKMPGRDGLQVQAELLARGLHLPVVFLTGHGDVEASVRAMKGGALDFLQKPWEPEVLLATVREALRRDAARRAGSEAVASLRARHARLSAREREVLDGVLAGRLNKQIAGDMGIVEKTVKVHRARVMEKMGAASLAELVRMMEELRRSPE
ncbi:MAG: response regulator [Gemmatimonadales bacterium]|jgi:FixJ family two-component response regulator|nr:response regulator [Gemmatimonadales bacterium]